jgi:L,D-peptidoglycan transpeptidase YkuD (ErfK/YbiS/YcfS/YnhG family)
MKLSRKSYIIISILVLAVFIALAAYAKSNSIANSNELKIAAEIAESKNTKLLEEKTRLEKEQKLEEQKKLDNEKKLADLKKLEDLQKLAKQKTNEEIAKQKAIDGKNQTSSTNQAKLKTVAAAPISKPKLLIDRIKGKGNAKQAIVVTTNGFGSVNATITAFENNNGNWKQVYSFSGNVGRTGFTTNKAEGDGHSPMGVFSLGTAFGRYSNPGASMNYRQSTTNDFWVDDGSSSLYNTWQKGPVSGRWSSAEKMYIPQYNYGFVINYNSNRIPDKGSAIFFHVWSGPGQGTAGCTAAAQNNVISILKWLKPSKSPVIIQGPMSEVTKM